MNTIESLSQTAAPRFYSGNGDLSGVDLQVFSLAAFIKHLSELECALRGLVISSLQTGIVSL